MEPVLLSEPILLMYGFIKLWHLSSYQFDLYIDEYLTISWYPKATNNEGLLCLYFSEDNIDENIDLGTFTVARYLHHIKYLDELENLYLSLTGNKLICK